MCCCSFTVSPEPSRAVARTHDDSDFVEDSAFRIRVVLRQLVSAYLKTLVRATLRTPCHSQRPILYARDNHDPARRRCTLELCEAICNGPVRSLVLLLFIRP